ncbi:N-acetylated-alpha-linked acidic dipeptidase 2-like [Penaeus japonicus]|uniref:N-acetylated-alpha-linked acidic dipeptidase 2-like n=1 Tax=Penaeus japonicus TaxID=27405 RepID=UPI001C70D5FF|nr:N-acetylated-alpha-linked acidic dipeptidase 2-like [Penaeus japonicus]
MPLVVFHHHRTFIFCLQTEAHYSPVKHTSCRKSIAEVNMGVKAWTSLSVSVTAGVAILLVAVNLGYVQDPLLPPVVTAEESCSSFMRPYMEDGIPDTYGRIKPFADDFFGTAGDELLKEMNTQNIESYLKYLTSQGHMAGTKQDLEQAEHLRKLWLEQGLDQVFLQPYHVQLSHPDIAKPNKVYLMDENGEVKFTSTIFEEPLDGVAYDDSIPPAFLAFAPAGTVVTDELVFVNYGRYEDFVAVEEMGIKIKGRVVIAKFGSIFRGDKVQNAERFNASGIILYTDPSDYHPESDSGGLAYPHSFWLPGSGIQRGSIVVHDGDPTTPGYPALEGAYRLPKDKTDSPRIPAHTLSYNDARKLLVNMGGPEVREDWKGRLNITYRMGPKLARKGWTLKLEVNNKKHIVPTYNVIGVIQGSEEPDRYVILGNHRDAWTFGSCDPSSATAVQMELTRALGQLVKQGWRPRRSIVFGSWGAGEYGFFGPWEWVEEYLKVFQMRAVAHLNVDLAIIYTYNIQISATPALHKIIKEATKKAPAPDKSLGYETLWDHWTSRHRAASPDLLDWKLGSISEHAPFYQGIGVPTSYMVWEINFDEFHWSDYPLYHTTFEDFDAMKNILDPEFRYHLSMGHLWGLMAIGLADARILPMDPEDETVMLRKMLVDLKNEYGHTLKQKGINFASVETVIDHFDNVAQDFNRRLSTYTNVSPLLARQLNDQLLMLEKCYIDAEGSPLRPHMKNMVFGTNNFNQYDGWTAPAVRDAIWEATQCQGECIQEWETVKQHISILQYVINSAVLAMKDFQTF